MTQRNMSGYQHVHAYRTWLPEQNELLRVIAVRGRDSTSLDHTMSLEKLSVCLGRSPTAISRQAEKLGVEILSEQEIADARAAIQNEADEFVSRYI